MKAATCFIATRHVIEQAKRFKSAQAKVPRLVWESLVEAAADDIKCAAGAEYAMQLVRAIQQEIKAEKRNWTTKLLAQTGSLHLSGMCSLPRGVKLLSPSPNRQQ